MDHQIETRLDETTGSVLQQAPTLPSVGIVLGSGLGFFADALAQPTSIGYQDIPHMPRPTVPGHGGRLVLGAVEGVRVACLEGRVHLYEGHDPERVVFGVRLLSRLGCRTVLLTNAAGAVDSGLGPGDLMLITDHLNLTGSSPLVGRVPPAFVDLRDAYDPAVRHAAHRAARETDLELKEGIYAGMLGPSYETPAEVRMLRSLGASAVGMSTVQEVIALRGLGVAVGAVSAITNLAAGLEGAVLDHAQVQDVARSRSEAFVVFLRRWVIHVARGAGGEANP